MTLRVPEPKPLADFLLEILDFRISDAIAGGYFLRCNVDHHGLGQRRRHERGPRMNRQLPPVLANRSR